MQRTDIARLAELSRIHIDDAEMDAIAADLSSIVQYVDQIGQVANAALAVDMRHRNVMRTDTVDHVPGDHTAAMVTQAPRHNDGYVVVQKIL